MSPDRRGHAPDVSSVFERVNSIRELLAAHGVQRLGVFGSVARGDANSDSDIDVIVDLDPRHETLSDLVAVADLLEEVLDADVDLVTRNGLSRYIAPSIEEEAKYVRIC